MAGHNKAIAFPDMYLLYQVNFILLYRSQTLNAGATAASLQKNLNKKRNDTKDIMTNDTQNICLYT